MTYSTSCFINWFCWQFLSGSNKSIFFFNMWQVQHHHYSSVNWGMINCHKTWNSLKIIRCIKKGVRKVSNIFLNTDKYILLIATYKDTFLYYENCRKLLYSKTYNENLKLYKVFKYKNMIISTLWIMWATARYDIFSFFHLELFIKNVVAMVVIF